MLSKIDKKILVCLSVIISASALFAHGIDEHKYELAGQDISVKIADPIPNANRFAQRLAENCQYLFTSPQLNTLHSSNSHFKLYSQFKEADKDKSMRNYTLGQNYLLELMDTYENFVEYDVSQGYTKMETPRNIEVPMQYGSVLLKVVTGDKFVAFKDVKLELEGYTEHQAPLEIDVEPDSVNWVLLGLWNVPAQSTGFFLDIKVQDKEYPAAIKVISSPTGEVAVDIFDENGKACSAMVRLTSAKTKTLYKPANALVFDWQMDNIAGYPKFDTDIYPDVYGKPYPASMPKPYGGHYWFVPKGFDMAMPAGKWQIHINHGFEYEPVFADFEVAAGKKIKLSYTLKRWIDMPSKGWYSGDDHIHSRLMSSSDADKLLTIIQAADIHVGNILMMGNSYRTFFEQRGYGKDYRVQDGDYILVPGQEDPRHFYGHGIGINLAEMVRSDDKYLDNAWIADEIHKGGGLYGQAHVLFNIFNIIRDIAVLLPQSKTDFGEIMQSGLLDTSVYYDFLNLGYKYTASTGSDMPFGHSVGESAIYAYTGSDVFDVDKWFDAVKAGNTFVTNGPFVEFAVDGAIPGQQVDIDSNHKLKIRVKAMGIPGLSAPKEIQLIKFGEVIDSVVSDDPKQGTLEMSCDVESEYGCWLAVKVISHNLAQAHTTPVYVVRDGFRFWDVDKAQKAIDRCMGVLDGMEQELNGFIEQDRAGSFPPSNLFGPQIAAQAPDALERFKQVRQIYKDLENTLEKEKQLRK